MSQRLREVAFSLLAFLLAIAIVEAFARLVFEPQYLAALTGRKPTLVYHSSQLDDALSGWTWPRNKRWPKGQKTTNSYGFVSTPELERIFESYGRLLMCKPLRTSIV